MNVFRNIALPILAVLIAMTPLSSKAGTYQVDFSETGSLEKIFDSGLRPHRQLSFEKYKCEVRNVDIQVFLPDGKILPRMAFDWGEFFVYQNDLLGSAEFRTESVSIDDAKQLLLPFLKLINDSSQEKLESMLQDASQDPLGFQPNFSAGVNGVPRWGVFVRKSFDKNRPLKIGVKIDWKRERTERAFRETVIEPPPGYENISMEPSPIQSQAQPSTTATQSSSVSTQQPRSTVAPQPTPSPTVTRPAPSGFPIVPVAVLAAVILGILLFVLRRKSK